MTPTKFAWTVAAGAVAVVVGGLLLNYGRGFALIDQAHAGFDRIG